MGIEWLFEINGKRLGEMFLGIYESVGGSELRK
jgi:hypothetical protein